MEAIAVHVSVCRELDVMCANMSVYDRYAVHSTALDIATGVHGEQSPSPAAIVMPIRGNINPTSPTGALFRTPPVPCAFLVIRALALPSAKLPRCRPQIPWPRRRHLVHEFSGFKFVLQKR